MASSTVEARLAEYLKQAEYSFTQPIRSGVAHDAFEAFSQASQYIPPVSLKSAGPISMRRQTKIPHFFPGWRPKLPNLPLDVLLEIASHMLPLDLLKCSRTSKVFRSALMSRSSRSVWITVLRSLPDFPPCPDDMSEPAYVALVFDDHCFSCAASKAYYMDYVLRIRLCDECWGKYVCSGTALLDDLPDIVCDVITMLVPAFDYDCSAVDEGRSWAHHLHPVSHVHQDLYYRPELEKMIHFCWPPPSPADLATLQPVLLQRVEYIIQRHIHGVQLYWWMRLATTSPGSYADELARDRVRVMQDIQERKYLLPYEPPVDTDDEDNVQNGNYDPNIYIRAELIRTCGAVCDHQDYEEGELREACDNAVRDACLAARRTEFRDWYEHMVTHHAVGYDRRMLPNRRDGGSIFDILAWENEARVPIDEDTFYSYVADNIPAILDDNIRNTMRRLAALVPYDCRIVPGMDSKFVNTVGGSDMDVLALARPDALFVCRECGAGACGLPWPEIHGHWRERHPHLSFWGNKDLGCPGKRPRVRLWTDGQEVVQAILDEAGLSTGLGRERLDRLVKTGRLYCACGDPELAGPGDLDWAKFVQHVWTHRETHRARCLAHDLTAPSPYDRTWIHDYSLGPCVTYLPKGADTTPAFSRCRADSCTRTTIGAVLARCPEEWLLICAVCDKLSTDKHGGQKDASLGIPKSIHAVAYHMEAKHGRPFADGDISFCKKLSWQRDLP